MAMMADSVEALATAAGIDAAGLAATIERFNGHAEGGTDPDFGRGSKLWSHSWGDSRQLNPNLGVLAKAPFYAIPLARVGTGLASAGLKTNAAARVIGVEGQPIEGLYAIGNAAARIEMGCGYNRDRKSVALGKSVSVRVNTGGAILIKKKNE